MNNPFFCQTFSSISDYFSTEVQSHDACEGAMSVERNGARIVNGHTLYLRTAEMISYTSKIN